MWIPLGVNHAVVWSANKQWSKRAKEKRSKAESDTGITQKMDQQTNNRTKGKKDKAESKLQIKIEQTN